MNNFSYKKLLNSQNSLFKKIDKRNMLLFAILILISFWNYLYDRQKNEAKNSASTKEEIDTFIPKGKVLVPIDLTNASAISALINERTHVDLYASSSRDTSKGARVATQIKLIRAPLNPNAFAVLVGESESQNLLSHGSYFYAVIKNPEEKSEIQNQPRKMPTKIIYN